MKKKNMVISIVTILVIMSYTLGTFGNTRIFQRRYIDSNTWTAVSESVTEVPCNYVEVSLDQILHANGTYTNYKKLKAKICLTVNEGEVVLATQTVNGSTVAGQYAHNEIQLGRTIPKSNYLPFYAMGNDARYDCVISGIYHSN